MKNILILIVILSIVFLSTACEKEETSNADPYIGGTDALKLEFMEGLPPPEVYDNNMASFGVGVELTNSGEYTVKKEDILLKIVGIKPDFIGWDGQSKSTDIDLLKTKKDIGGNIREGTITNVIFDNLIVSDKIVGGINEYPMFRVEACYKYGTEISVISCINENFFGTRKNDICDIREENVVYNSGAPIKVTSVKQTPISENQLQFIITIEKKGLEKLYSVTDTTCAGEKYYESNLVYFNMTDSEFTNEFQCSGLSTIVGEGVSPQAARSSEGYITLYKSSSGQPKAIVNCYVTLEENEKNDYVAPVKINLEYRYEDYIDKPLIVKSIDIGD